jgi:histidinol-phosphatase (PHP family)
MSDYHLHLHPHQPSDEGPPPGEYPPGHIEAYVEAAAREGVGELGFTEHLYRCVESRDALGDWWEQEPDPRLAAHTRGFVAEDRNLSLEAYVTAVEDAKGRGLPVLLGLEVDFFPESIGAVLDLLDPYPWDFLIGSVHWIGGWAIDSSAAGSEWENRSVERGYNQYFALETQLAASGAVDVLAHVDLPKKYGHRLPEEPVHHYEAVVAAAAASGTAVEVSSQGLRKPAAEVYPSPRFLSMFYEAGVPITLASDGHFPSEAAWGHDAVVGAARAAGYSKRLQFRRGVGELVPLGG